jgi:predicted dehydrogenase
VLKALATLPILGYFAQRFYVKYQRDFKTLNQKALELTGQLNSPVRIPATGMSSAGDRIRVGVVGYGQRGPQTFRALGYASEEWARSKTLPDGSPNPSLETFLAQDDLNIEITGVCDTFSPRAQEAAEVVATTHRAGGAPIQKSPKIFPTYREMIADGNIDALLIQTPDHWHARMSVDAARSGIHVYLEKPMCQTAEEAKELKQVVEETGIILQVGHQNRQQASYIKAKEVIDKGVIGNISAIETYTNRNTDHGAWIRGIDPLANESNVNWEEFLGHKAWREMDLDRYFNWQKWFECGTGPAGNQFTHEFDCVNQVLNLGIPEQVIALGGIYYYKDPRDIPDVFNAVFEYPSKGLTLTYDCTLKNSKLRNKTFLGDKGSMEVNVGLAVYTDVGNEEPVFTYHPKTNVVDAVTSATTKYYEDRGFGYTYANRQKIDATYLHMKEWLYCIRNDQQPSCSVNQGFEETVTFSMANKAYLEKRVVEWDAERQMII